MRGASLRTSTAKDHCVRNIVTLVADMYDSDVGFATGAEITGIGLADVGTNGLPVFKENRAGAAIRFGHRDGCVSVSLANNTEGAGADRLP